MTNADSWDIKILSRDQTVKMQNFVLLEITNKYKAKLTFFAFLRRPLMSYCQFNIPWRSHE